MTIKTTSQGSRGTEAFAFMADAPTACAAPGFADSAGQHRANTDSWAASIGRVRLPAAQPRDALLLSSTSVRKNRCGDTSATS
jgi:hypothetical protein